MGIEIKTVTTCTCDICGKECGERDGEIKIKVNDGDGRDVGPAFITGRLTFSQPYGVSGGIVCQACKIKYLNRFISQLTIEPKDD